MRAPWRIVGIAAALAVFPLVARAQSADLNTSTPTKNDFRLRVVEPAEGATVAGPQVRVTIGNAVPADRGETGAEISKTSPVPRPDIQVVLDGKEQGVIRDPQNVLTLENVSPGPHKLVVIAKNKSGEIVDRKEVSFDVSGSSASSAETSRPPATSEATAGSADTTDRGTAPPPPSNGSSATYGGTASGSSGTSSQTTTGSSSTSSATGSTATPYTSDEPATSPSRDSASSPATESAPSGAPSGQATSNDTMPPKSTRRSTSTTGNDLPKTGTPYPAIAVAGAALLAAGFWLRRGAGAR